MLMGCTSDIWQLTACNASNVPVHIWEEISGYKRFKAGAGLNTSPVLPRLWLGSTVPFCMPTPTFCIPSSDTHCALQARRVHLLIVHYLGGKLGVGYTLMLAPSNSSLCLSLAAVHWQWVIGSRAALLLAGCCRVSG